MKSIIKKLIRICFIGIAVSILISIGLALKGFFVERSSKKIPNLIVNQVDDKFNFIKHIIKKTPSKDSFHVVDLHEIVQKYELWKKTLPNVEPFYAIKANHDPVIVAKLASLGSSFDCATKNEILQVLKLNINPSKIIYAHPRKSIEDIDFAYKRGIDKMVVDSLEEIDKILSIDPSINIIIRIATDDSHSGTSLSKKFGAPNHLAIRLIDHCYENNAHLCGISFHVGSNCFHHKSYVKAIKEASKLFEYSLQKHNIKLTLLDIGGGWPGTDDEAFKKISQHLKDELNKYLDKNIKIIAEPGRYMVASSTTLVSKIFSKDVSIAPDGKIKYSYFITNGVYGYFLSSLYFGHDYKKTLQEGWKFRALNELPFMKKYLTKLWGPTCDSGDMIVDGIFLPELNVGDYICTEFIGAYGDSLQTDFHQISRSKPYYVYINN